MFKRLEDPGGALHVALDKAAPRLGQRHLGSQQRVTRAAQRARTPVEAAAVAAAGTLVWLPQPSAAVSARARPLRRVGCHALSDQLRRCQDTPVGGAGGTPVVACVTAQAANPQALQRASFVKRSKLAAKAHCQ